MTDSRRGICQVCAREFDVRTDGKIRHHLKPRQSQSWCRTPRCEGADQPALPLGTTVEEGAADRRYWNGRYDQEPS